MSRSPSYPPTFSRGRKWSIAFNVMLATAAVFLILIGVNYLDNRPPFFKRIYLSANSHIELSPKTIGLLHSLTNNVEATIYYDRREPLYSEIVDLLKEYQAHTRKLSLKTVDYYSDPGAAEDLKLKYKQISNVTNRDFIIFDSDGRQKFVDGNSLSDYKVEFERLADSEDQRLAVNRKRIAFSGEEHFSSALFAVTQPTPLKAYFLQGHGEHSPNDKNDNEGYWKLADVFHRNYVATDVLDGLLGTNTVPADCNLLVIAGPTEQFETNELAKISQYLDQGGRLFALFNVFSTNRQTGLENILAKWNVQVSHSVVRDPEDANDTGNVLLVLVQTAHDVTKSIVGKRLQVVLPRPIERIKPPSPSGADELQVAQLAFTGTNSMLADNPSGVPHPYPLIAAVERNAAKGIATERGTTRMLIAGDSFFLDNLVIDYSANEDFADSAINWLLDRTELLGGIGARPVIDYRLSLAQKQVGEVKGILLGAIPGGILMFGGLVWLRRRK